MIPTLLSFVKNGESQIQMTSPGLDELQVSMRLILPFLYLFALFIDPSKDGTYWYTTQSFCPSKLLTITLVGFGHTIYDFSILGIVVFAVAELWDLIFTQVCLKHFF